ncbi:MAG: molybdenum cofactor guanylyltransferase [Bryobacteraceae bacterium]
MFELYPGKSPIQCYYLGMQAAGFVLVGGRSTRMGRDKALLRCNSSSLLEEVASKVAAAAGSVALIGEPERYAWLGWDCLPDLRPGLGPLAGIEAALESRRGEVNLIVACDMPGLETPWLLRLLAKTEETNAPCVVARDADRQFHPLLGVYKTVCLPAVRNALDHKRLKVSDLVRGLQAVTLDIGQTIRNVNTPEDWAAWRESA